MFPHATSPDWLLKILKEKLLFSHANLNALEWLLGSLDINQRNVVPIILNVSIENAEIPTTSVNVKKRIQ